MIITIGRKPFKGSLIDNVKREECGGLFIDGTRVSLGNEINRMKKAQKESLSHLVLTRIGRTHDTPELNDKGRFPANFILQTDTATTLDDQSGILKSGSLSSKQYEKNNENNRSLFFGEGQTFKHKGYEANEGGASRYFKVIK